MDINKETVFSCLILTTFVLPSTKAADPFLPVIELESCLQGKATIKLHGGADGGIIYVQDRGPVCRHETRDMTSQIEFSFIECNIEWGQTFKVVIQKNALYQTGDDKQIPVTCYHDISDIKIGGDVEHSELPDEPGISSMTRPRARMLLLSNDNNVAGQTIRLGDNITMVIQLESQYEDDFDIDVNTCFADSIVLLREGCSVKQELFPDFIKVRQGKLWTMFRAFKPTQLHGGTVTMSFRCILGVHLGNQTKSKCIEIENVADNKNLDIIQRHKKDVTSLEDIHVAATVHVSETNKTTPVSPKSSTEFSCQCIKMDIFIGVTLCLVACVVISAAIIICLRQKLKHVQINRRLTKDEIHHLMQITSRQ